MSSPSSRKRPMLCRQGWHARLSEDGITYVRFGTRMTDPTGTYIYRIGPIPDDRSCTTIWCYGDMGVAWRCSLCGRAILGLERAGGTNEAAGKPPPP